MAIKPLKCLLIHPSVHAMSYFQNAKVPTPLGQR